MSSDEYYTDESSGFSMGEEIHRRANREQYGSSGPGSRDVGTQMKTHYILEPQRYFSKVRDVGTQTIENANHVIRNPRILSNSYSEAIRVKKEEKEFSFVYDRRKDELYRIRIVSGSEGNSEEDDSSTASSESSDSRSVHSSGFSHSIDEIHDELRNKRTVGVQMSTKYLVQESRPKVVLRDVAIQTKLANVYGHSQSKMIEQLWRSKTPLSKNVICTLPNSWRQKSDISPSDISYTSDLHHRTKRKSVPSHRKLDTSHRQPGSAWYFENSYDFDQGTSTFVKEGMQQNANSSMLNSSVTKHTTGKHVVSKTEESAYSMSKQYRKWKSKRGSSKGHRCHSSGKSSISTASSVSSRSGHGRPERKSGKKEENFELTSFEYLGDHSSVRLKSEISSISTQTDTERKGPKVFRDPSRKLVSEQQLGDWTVVAEVPKNQRSDNESGIELTYSPPQLTQEKVSLYTRDHSPTPVEPVASCRYPYRPTVNPVYKDEVKMQETDNSLERSSQKSSQNSDRNKDYRSCSVEIGPEPNVLPAEFIEKPVIKTRVRKRKPPPPPNVAIRVGGGWMKEEHHRIQHRPLHRNFMATSDRIPFVRSQFHHNPLKIPVVNKERKHTDKMRYASFIP